MRSPSSRPSRAATRITPWRRTPSTCWGGARGWGPPPPPPPPPAPPGPPRRAIADALLKGGKKSELGQEYQSLIAQSPPTAEGLYDAGLIAQQLGRQKDAEAAWRRLQTEFPKHALATRASLELAQAAFKRSQFKDAAALGKPASA